MCERANSDSNYCRRLAFQLYCRHHIFPARENEGDSKVYTSFEKERITELRERGIDILPIKGSHKMHNTVFKPNGTIFSKDHKYACLDCLHGNFSECKMNKGSHLVSDGNFLEHNNEESDIEDYANVDFSYQEQEQVEREALEICVNCVFDAIEIGATIALLSPPNVRELVYLCKVIDLLTLVEDKCDAYNYATREGEKYLISQYYAKVREGKGFVEYKLLKPHVYVLLHRVTMLPVKIDKEMRLSSTEHLFIADCC